MGQSEAPQLTPDECKALRLAAIFGKPDKRHDVLEAAIEKLHRIERAASNDPYEREDS